MQIIDEVLFCKHCKVYIAIQFLTQFLIIFFKKPKIAKNNKKTQK